MPTVILGPPGAETTLAGGDGTTVMQVVRASGVAGFGECEGSLACATCHVVVDPAWAAKLDPASEDEEAMLDTVFDLQPTSRLSCQIRLSPALDGISRNASLTIRRQAHGRQGSADAC